MERQRRLRESSSIRRVRGRGRSFAEGPLVAKILPNGSAPPANRYTVIAGKKQGNSVKRNRVKRLVREALRHLHPALVRGVDIAVIVRGKADDIPSYKEARELIDRIVRRAGLLVDPALAQTPNGSGLVVAGSADAGPPDPASTIAPAKAKLDTISPDRTTHDAAGADADGAPVRSLNPTPRRADNPGH